MTARRHSAEGNQPRARADDAVATSRRVPSCQGDLSRTFTAITEGAEPTCCTAAGCRATASPEKSPERALSDLATCPPHVAPTLQKLAATCDTIAPADAQTLPGRGASRQARDSACTCCS